ncbi:MAG: fumarate hydratase [Anaerohalosphaeraceae bacterium]|nr:fumarate hydratase [Anaerohalosphaeraceae bacterium]
MRKIPFEKIVSTVKTLCVKSCYELPQDVIAHLKASTDSETNSGARKIIDQLLENADVARGERIPICQDTGLTIVFLEIGKDIIVEPPADSPDATIIDAVNAGIVAGYEEGYLRKSVVAEPLNERKNTNTNTPAVVHIEIVPGEELSISVMTKGGGCENKSRFKMFLPTDSKETVIDWIADVVEQAGANACPPFVVGVGIGGNFEKSCLLSKKALLRNLDSKNPQSFYAKMEKQLLEKINASGLGPQGLGGDTTALAVLIETAPCHIASLPVAVNIECHAHRHASAIL